MTVKGTDHIHNGPWLEMKFRQGVTYRMEVSGEVDISPGPNSRKIDAIYCFESHSGTSCDPPYVVCGVQLTYYTYDAEPEKRAYQGWNNFQCPQNAPEYGGLGHAYEGTITPTSDAAIRVGVSGYDSFPDDNTGSFNVKVYGPPEPTPTPPVETPKETCETIGDVVGGSGGARVTRGDGRAEAVTDRTQFCVGDVIDTGSAFLIVRIDVGFGESTVILEPGTRLALADAIAKQVVVHLGALSTTDALKQPVKTPNAVVRRTATNPRVAATPKLSVAYDPSSRRTTVIAGSAALTVDPTGAGATARLAPGKAADVTAKGVRTVPTKRARARLKARELVSRRIGKATRCGAVVKTIGLTQKGRRWRVVAKTSKGKSVWLVQSSKAKPVNGLAERLARNCP